VDVTPKTTKEEYEASYAVRSGILLPQLRLMGIEAVPCHCGAPDCPGWTMAQRERAPVIFVDDNLIPYEDRSLC